MLEKGKQKAMRTSFRCVRSADAGFTAWAERLSITQSTGLGGERTQSGQASAVNVAAACVLARRALPTEFFVPLPRFGIESTFERAQS